MLKYTKARIVSYQKWAYFCFEPVLSLVGDKTNATKETFGALKLNSDPVRFKYTKHGVGFGFIYARIAMNYAHGTTERPGPV